MGGLSLAQRIVAGIGALLIFVRAMDGGSISWLWPVVAFTVFGMLAAARNAPRPGGGD